MTTTPTDNVQAQLEEKVRVHLQDELAKELRGILSGVRDVLRAHSQEGNGTICVQSLRKTDAYQHHASPALAITQLLLFVDTAETALGYSTKWIPPTEVSLRMVTLLLGQLKDQVEGAEKPSV